MASIPTTTSIRSGTFWSSLKRHEHLVQCYSAEATLLDALESFVSNGLREGDGVIVIASAPHLHELEKRLRAHWLAIDRARWEGRYIPLLAQEVLGKFMVGGMPDERRFDAEIGRVVATARGNGRKVRAYGEMVSILLGEGNIAGTMMLESLWCERIPRLDIMLFCGYERAAFSGNVDAIKGIAQLHTMQLPG